jgi:hypothetical protein
MTSAAVAAGARRGANFRNLYVLPAALLIGGAGVVYFGMRWKTTPGWAALVVGLFGMWILIHELRGVAIANRVLSFPHRPLRSLPLVSLSRRQVPLPQLEEMTVLRPWFGLQVVLLEGGFGAERLLFHSRNARMKFLEVVKAELPRVRVYRAQ